MPTESQINANRKNAQKSTGPRTPEGKARSSRNSTIHGLTGKWRKLPNEQPKDLLEMHEDYREALQPIDALEEGLVERLVVAQYRLRRIARIEVGYFDLRVRMDKVPDWVTEGGEGEADLLAWAFLQDCRWDAKLQLLARYEAHLQREASRCLNDLYKLRGERRKEAAEAAKAAQAAEAASAAATAPSCGARGLNKTNPKRPVTLDLSAKYKGPSRPNGAFVHPPAPPDDAE
jgi:hypothetical protein